jgi:DNA-binding IclR family transcriptional regulator
VELYVNIWNMVEYHTGRRRSSRATAVDTGVGVLDRTIAILDAVGDGSRTFTDLVRATGFSRPTTHRLIKAMEAHGLLSLQGGFGYRLGPRLLRLATIAMAELPLRDLARPALERLSEVTGESAQLYVRSGDERVCVDTVESTSELRTIVPVGSSLPLTAGSAGKVFLAWASEPDRERLLEKRLERFTPKTPTALQIRGQVDAIRRRGWSMSSGERERGVGSVSAAILGPDGELVAVVSISGPESRVGVLAARRFSRAVVAAAREIERALGIARPSRRPR